MERLCAKEFIKVTSLIGVWNRTAFLHSDFVATLEDMFDATRFSSHYVPTGYKPYGVEKMAVQGHPLADQPIADRFFIFYGVSGPIQILSFISSDD